MLYKNPKIPLVNPSNKFQVMFQTTIIKGAIWLYV